MYNAPSVLLVARVVSGGQAVSYAAKRTTRTRRRSILRRALERLGVASSVGPFTAPVAA